MCNIKTEEDNIEEIFNEILGYNAEEAIKYCKERYEETKDYEYVIYLAKAYLFLEMYIEAIETANLVIDSSYDYLVQGLNIKGEAQLELGFFEESRKSFEEALQIYESNFISTSFLVELDINEGLYENAINRAVDFIEKYGDNKLEVADLMSAIGWTYLINMKNVEIAIEAFEEAIKNDINCHRAYTGIGIYYIYKKNYYEAIEYLNKAIEINREDGENYFGLAICYKELSIFEKVEENLVQANSLEPMDDRILLEYGFELLRQEKEIEALSVFEILVDNSSDYYDINKLVEDLRKKYK